jgi:PAS domain S-box-containing protein
VDLLGYSSFQELALRNLEHEGFEPDYSRQDFRERIERDGFVSGVESRWRRRDGSVVIVRENAKVVRDTQGRAVCYEGTVEDITKRTRAEEALRAERDFNTSLVQASPTFFVAIGADGRTLMMNRAMLTALGYTEQEVRGVPYLQTFVPADDRARLAQVFDELVRQRKPTLNENRVVGKDGRELLVEWHGRPVFMDNGEFDFFFGVGIDITERRRLEEQYRQAQKMEALGLLAGGIAHDFNNLLTAMLGNAEFVLKKFAAGASADKRLVACLEAVVSAANRAVSLTRQLLAIGRGHAVKPVSLNLNDVVSGMVELLKRFIGEHIRLRVDAEPDPAVIEADPAQVEQIIMNLAVNARDAMPDGGDLGIRTANVMLSEVEAAKHTRATAGKHMALIVADTGTGMNARTIERIFEPFFTTKPIGQGTGLGLATVFGIVNQSGGFITVDSELGRGSVFTVHFPAVDRPLEPTTRPAPGAWTESDLSGEETILVCEDEETIRQFAAEILGYQGYKVLTAENGRHALEVAADYGDIIHLLLTDVVMPEMNGRDLAVALHTERPSTKVLFMSGYSSDVLGTETPPTDAIPEILEKPFTSSELLSRVRRALDEESP